MDKPLLRVPQTAIYANLKSMKMSSSELCLLLGHACVNQSKQNAQKFREGEVEDVENKGEKEVQKEEDR